MRAAVQPQPVQAPSTNFSTPVLEQERFPADFSDEESWKDHQRKVEKFLHSCDELRRQAEANGLTDEILAGILADE